jgi:prepilin peptidase CpaA
VQSASIVPIAVASVFALVAAGFDIRSFRIPNLLTVPFLLSGIVYHAANTGVAGLVSSLLGAFFGFGVLFLLYLMGGMGAGDVKLMAGVGAWLGMPLTVYAFGVAGLAAGAYSVVVVLWQGRFRDTLVAFRVGLFRLWTVGKHLGAQDRVESLVKQPGRRRRLIPFAMMVALAMVVVLAWSWRG